MSELRQDITRTTLAVLFIGGLIAASFWAMRSFLPRVRGERLGVPRSLAI